LPRLLKPKKKPHGKGRPWPKGVSENPSGKPSRLTKMGEEFMREMFKPVEPDFADSHFLGSQLGVS
jgi:hypothetical protein